MPSDWNVVAARVAERKASTPADSTPMPHDEGSPQVRFRGFQGPPRPAASSSTVGSPPLTSAPLPGMAFDEPRSPVRSAAASLHTPYMGNEAERGIGMTGGRAGKSSGGPRLGGLGLMHGKGETLPPLKLNVQPSSSSAPVEPAPTSAGPSQPVATPRTAALLNAASRPPANPSTSASTSGKTRQTQPRQAGVIGESVPVQRKPSKRRRKSGRERPSPGPAEGRVESNGGLGGRGPPVDREMEREVQRVLSRVPDDPALVRAMLADILIRAQRGELTATNGIEQTSASQSQSVSSCPSPLATPAALPNSLPTLAIPVARPPATVASGSSRSSAASPVERTDVSTLSPLSPPATTRPLAPFAARRSSTSSGSIAGSSMTSSSRRGSVLPPPTPPPTSPLPPTPSEYPTLLSSVRASDKPHSIPEGSETSITANGVKPRQGALPLFRQNLDLVALDARPSLPELASRDVGRGSEDLAKSTSKASDESPVAAFDPFGEERKGNPGLAPFDEPDDAVAEQHFWSKMETLGLASRLRSSVASTSDSDAASSSDPTVPGEQVARDRANVDLLARISLLRAKHDRPRSSRDSVISNADSFATAESDSLDPTTDAPSATAADIVESQASDGESVYDDEAAREAGGVPGGKPEVEEGEMVLQPEESWEEHDLGTIAQDIDRQLVVAPDQVAAVQHSPRQSPRSITSSLPSEHTYEPTLLMGDDARQRSQPSTRSGSSSGGTGHEPAEPTTPPEVAVGRFAGASAIENGAWSCAAQALASEGSPIESAADVSLIVDAVSVKPSPQSTVAAAKAIHPAVEVPDYIDMADGDITVAIPRRAPRPESPPPATLPQLLPGSSSARNAAAALPSPPFQLFQPRTRAMSTGSAGSTIQDAVDSAAPVASGPGSKRSSINVADLKAALAHPAAGSGRSELANPASSSPTASAPTPRVQRSFLPAPVPTSFAADAARVAAPKPEPIAEEPEQLSDTSDEGESAMSALEDLPPSKPEQEARRRTSSAEPSTTADPAPSAASQLPSQSPPVSWGFGGIGGIASGLARVGNAAWEWGASMSPQLASASPSRPSMASDDMPVPGQFQRSGQDSVDRVEARLLASGRSSPDSAELLEEWKDVIPAGVDPSTFIAEVRDAMRLAKTETDRPDARTPPSFPSPNPLSDEAPSSELSDPASAELATRANAIRQNPDLATAAGSPKTPEPARILVTPPVSSRRRRRVSSADDAPPVIPERSVSTSLAAPAFGGGSGSASRRVSTMSTVSSSDSQSLTSRKAGLSKSKTRRGFRGLFGRSSSKPVPDSPNSSERPASVGSGGSSSELRSNSLMSTILGKQKVSTTQQIESSLQDMTYVSYDTGKRRDRSRSASIDIPDSPVVPEEEREPTAAGSRPRRSSLKRQSRYGTVGRKRSLTPAESIPEDEEKAIYGVRFANATRGLGLRSVAEDEAALAGGDHHALRWIGVGRGRYGELELVGDEAGDELYAEQVKEIRAKWRNFGRNAGTDWSRVKVD